MIDRHHFPYSPPRLYLFISLFITHLYFSYGMLETAAEIASRIALYQTTAFAPRKIHSPLTRNYDERRSRVEQLRRSEDSEILELPGTEAHCDTYARNYKLSASAGVCSFTLTLLCDYRPTLFDALPVNGRLYDTVLSRLRFASHRYKGMVVRVLDEVQRKTIVTLFLTSIMASSRFIFMDLVLENRGRLWR
ncbi:hypothetical protein QCA50_013280 [Cerrena zonata]|uniref:Uncharacterized protein n=1 Tax=Cerrena zonata TaxID=2478898 RepID=A0AAW0G0L2_9APHY